MKKRAKNAYTHIRVSKKKDAKQVVTCHKEAKMLEKKIEKWLVERLKSMGCIADKFVSPGMSGVPDRIVIIPGGRVMFLELKTMAGRVDPLQELQHKRYRRAGAEVRIIKGMDDARAFAMEVETIIRIGAQTW